MLLRLAALVVLLQISFAQDAPGLLTQASDALKAQKEDQQQATLKLLSSTTKSGLSYIRDIVGNQWNKSAGYMFVPAGYSYKSPLPLLVYMPSERSSADADLEAFDGLIGLQNVGALVFAPQPTGKAGWSGDNDTPFLNDLLTDLFQVIAVDPRRIAFGGYSDGATAAMAWGANNPFVSTLIAYSPTSNPILNKARNKPRVYISFGDRDTDRLDDMHRILNQLKSDDFDVQFDEFSGSETVPDTVLTASLQWWATGATN